MRLPELPEIALPTYSDATGIATCASLPALPDHAHHRSTRHERQKWAFTA